MYFCIAHEEDSKPACRRANSEDEPDLVEGERQAGRRSAGGEIAGGSPASPPRRANVFCIAREEDSKPRLPSLARTENAAWDFLRIDGRNGPALTILDTGRHNIP